MPDDPVAPRPYVLRLHDGALNGVEFPLCSGQSHFRIGNDDLPVSCPAPCHEDDLIPLPGDVPASCFSLELANQPSAKGFRLISYLHGKPQPATRPFHQPCQIAGQTFSVHPVDSMARPPVVKVSKPYPGWWLKMGWILLLVLLVLLLPDRLGQTGVTPGQLMELLENPNHVFIPRAARGGRICLLAQDAAGASWARQVLARTQWVAPVTILVIPEEVKRLDRWLADTLPGFLSLQLTQPAHPQIRVRADRLAIDKQRVAAVLAQMPYADRLVITPVSGQELEQAARNLLARFAISYRVAQAKDGGMVMMLQAPLDDRQREAFHQAWQAFNAQYGRRWVSFQLPAAAEGRQLRGKSFAYGQNHYALLGPQHWYFPPEQQRSENGAN